jgi:hypothetical protein
MIIAILERNAVPALLPEGVGLAMALAGLEPMQVSATPSRLAGEHRLTSLRRPRNLSGRYAGRDLSLPHR